MAIRRERLAKWQDGEACERCGYPVDPGEKLVRHEETGAAFCGMFCAVTWLAEERRKAAAAA